MDGRHFSSRSLGYGGKNEIPLCRWMLHAFTLRWKVSHAFACVVFLAHSFVSITEMFGLELISNKLIYSFRWMWSLVENFQPTFEYVCHNFLLKRDWNIEYVCIKRNEYFVCRYHRFATSGITKFAIQSSFLFLSFPKQIELTIEKENTEK